MLRRVNHRLVALLCACGALLCVPAPALASSGGSGIGPGGQANGDAQTSGPASQPGDGTVTASGDGMTIAAHASALLRNGLQISGQLPAGDAGAVVEIERRGAKTGWTWQPTAQATVGSGGSFAATWETNHIGRFYLRAVLQRSGASASSGIPSVTVTVYRPSVATLYGPGFWGKRTACGTILRRQTVGVANRTLPCGTPVAVYYNGQTLIVPVIDRGPYANGADWDLTMATGKALGMTGTATVGAVSLPRAG